MPQIVLRMQVTEAREAQKRAEAQLSKARQMNEQLSAEVRQLGQQIASLTQMSERLQTDLAQANDEMARLRAERESLIQQVATATGKLSALGEQIKSLEAGPSARKPGLKRRLSDR